MGEIAKIKVNGDLESSYQLYPRNEEFAKRSEGVHLDWNQNDETQPDYVKNRPFYTGDPVETVLVEESTVTFADHNGLYLAEFTSTFEATVGETYKVYWDSSVYECVCVDFNGMLTIGNLSIMGAGPDTGEPFFMTIHNGEGIEIFTSDNSASHTISISQEGEPEVVKINPKYLPKTAFITYDSNTDTYSSDLTNDELYEIMLDGRQVVLRTLSSDKYYYFTKWEKQASGRIDLAFAAGDSHFVSLYTDGTIRKTPIS